MPRILLALAAVAALTVIAFPSNALAAPPPNDNFASATVINPSSLPFSDTVDNSQATVEPGESLFCTGAPRTVWYSITPTVSGVYKVDTSGSSFFDSAVTVYQQNGSGLGGLSLIRCNSFPGVVTFAAQAGTTYYIQADDSFTGGGNLNVKVQLVPPPSNDDFANAKAITSLPFTDSVDTTGATIESGEPFPCGSTGGTVWYSFTPARSGSVTESFSAPFSVQVAAYTGSTLGSLTSVGCLFGSPTIHVDAGTTYYFQVGAFVSGGGPIQLQFVQTPPPTAQLFFFPNDPSIYDTLQFFDQSFDPGGVGFSSEAWNFGDGASATGCCPTHQYKADGDYTVKLTVGTRDGRSASTTQVVHVRTHDVTISKLTVPQSASAGQTRQISVGVSDSRYPETVSVQLLASVPGGGFQQVGVLQQQVAARGNTRPTTFSFSYTFTKADASVGKVTFEAIATIVGARDAQPSDNTVVALPTRVNG